MHMYTYINTPKSRACSFSQPLFWCRWLHDIEKNERENQNRGAVLTHPAKIIGPLSANHPHHTQHLDKIVSPRFEPISPLAGWTWSWAWNCAACSICAFKKKLCEGYRAPHPSLHTIYRETTTAGLHHACCACCICAACRGQKPVMDWGGLTILTTALQGKCMQMHWHMRLELNNTNLDNKWWQGVSIPLHAECGLPESRHLAKHSWGYQQAKEDEKQLNVFLIFP